MDFKLNLIKNDVLPSDKRKIVFFSMILYIFIIGLILVSLSYKTASTFVKTADYKRDAANFKNAHLNDINGRNDISGYIKDMKDKMLYYAGKLESVNKILSKYVNLPGILKGLSASLPAGSSVDNFSFNSEANTLEFDIIMPEGQAKDRLNTNELISNWKKNGYLMSCIKDIESTSVSKQARGESSVFVSKFSCSLSNEGS